MLRPRWESLLHKHFGQRLPESYLCFDLETTGLKRSFDLPIDFGWVLVAEREIADSGNFVLDWTRRPEWAEPGWLAEQLERVRGQLAAKGVGWDYTPQRLRAEGEDPLWVLEFAYNLLTESARQTWPAVGHNAYTYDIPLLTSCFNEFLASPWPVPDELIIDTGCLEKAACSRDILNPAYHVTPAAGEAPVAFFKRCYNRRLPGVLWNIAECVKRYELTARHDLHAAHLHGASTDALALHYLLELNRE